MVQYLQVVTWKIEFYVVFAAQSMLQCSQSLAFLLAYHPAIRIQPFMFDVGVLVCRSFECFAIFVSSVVLCSNLREVTVNDESIGNLSFSRVAV